VRDSEAAVAELPALGVVEHAAVCKPAVWLVPAHLPARQATVRSIYYRLLSLSLSNARKEGNAAQRAAQRTTRILFTVAK
jgi:hypothetical protein